MLNDTIYDPIWFDLDPSLYYENNNNSCGFIPNAHIIDEVDRKDMWQTTEPPTGTPISGIGSTVVRMDLFDKDKHFAHLVPLKALRDALLRNAIAAVAAKQLGRVKGHKLFGANQCQKPAMMEVIEDASNIDWFYKAANYYDKAIAFSRTYLAALSGDMTRPSSPNAPPSPSMGNSDDLLAAVSIFSLYESLDNMELGMIGWFQHLTGLRSLFTAVSANQQEQGQLIPSITVGRQASFWNFARADWQAAYYNRQKTLIDTEDVRLWRSCGLQLPFGGSLYTDPISIKNDPLHCREIVQLVTHTILWLVLRVTNYLASDSQQDSQARQAMWEELTAQLEVWYGNLPETFRPCAQIRYPLQMRSRRGGTSQLTEVFFSIHQCAAAIQLYHFACILLLLNKPSAGMGVMSRLKAYREISAEATKHARSVVGIALGRPHPAVRVEMNLPLYVAGGCLEADEERKVVLELLRAIEQDTGVSTEVKVRSLIDEWGWAQEPEGII
ncbi:hypothetical protein LTR08_004408 [Meristemomyces frigidus]|nr:hypothetical protein LTR08_004408 [Meristemomyces frigidus]